MTLSTNALMSRIALSDHAEHSIDLQYYIFKNDATGRLVAQRLLSAADRGVRIRILLDHHKVENEIGMLEALDAHDQIEVRLFNPYNTKEPTLVSKVSQFVLEGQRLNRRMHNKSFIVDNVVAVVGGRNIGDDYFDASDETKFRDLDLIAIGSVVRDASRSFDAYWNSDAAYPLAAFRTKHKDKGDLAKLREDLVKDVRSFAQSDYAQAVMNELPSGPTADRRGEWFWGPAELVADQPEKVQAKGDRRDLRIGPKLKTEVDATRSELLLMSPYFIPGDEGAAYLTGLAKRGVAVKVLTNSLASTDEPAVHSAYVHYRHPLLEGGVEIYELRPSPLENQGLTSQGASSGISLHAKAFVVDRKTVFIGSMNMDPRSRLLNTEMGLIVDCPPLADAVTRFFTTATSPANAYKVTLEAGNGTEHGHLLWTWTDRDAPLTTVHEPGASPKRRVQVALLRLLPIDGIL
jgi:putative cardiolipin synthase